MLFASLLLVATGWLGVSGLQFRTDAELASSAGDRDDISRWQVIGSPLNADPLPGGIRLENRARSKAQLRLPADMQEPRGPGNGWVRFSARIDGNITSFSPKHHRHPVVASWFESADGTRIRVAPRELAMGQTLGRQWSEVRARPPATERAVIGLFLRGASGYLALGDARIEVVSLSPAYLTLAGAIAAATIGLLAFGTRGLKGSVSLVFLCTPIAIAVAIAILVSLSGNMVDAWLKPLIATTLGEAAAKNIEATFTRGHVFAFAALTFSLLMLRRYLCLTRTRCLLLVALLSVFSEVLQTHVPSRNSELDDLFADASGIALGFAGWFLVTAALSLSKRRTIH